MLFARILIDLTDCRRPATVEDGGKFAKLVDVLPNYDISTGGVYPPGLADIQLEVWSYMVSLIHSTKPILAASTSKECARTIIRKAEVAGLKLPQNHYFISAKALHISINYYLD